MCIIKDLMNGNENLPEGCEEEKVGHNAIAAGFQGQRQWTDFYPNCDFPEAMLNTSFDWNGAREPYILATENDVLNGLGMMFMKLLTGILLDPDHNRGLSIPSDGRDCRRGSWLGRARRERIPDDRPRSYVLWPRSL